MAKHQYMIVVCPTSKASSEIDKLRRDFAEKHQSFTAMETPAHITLIRPFHADVEQIDQVEAIIKSYTPSIQLHLNNYGFFEQNKVVFLAPEPSPELDRLQNELQTKIDAIEPTIKTIKYNTFTPHITVSYRDLEALQFRNIVDEYQSKKIDITMTIQKATIWKRDNKKWLEV